MKKLIKSLGLRYISNLPGARTKRKFIVFESDDWGSLRMPLLSTFEKLENLGLDLRSLDAERYNQNDTLASKDDLEVLFEILSQFKDNVGNNTIITPITIVANPDFIKIEESGFNEYYYEPFTETLKRYPGCENSFDLWKEGIQKKIFMPQMHGREHLNVIAWMRALKMGDKQTRLAFNERMWGFVPDPIILPQTDFQAAFLFSNPQEIEFHKRVIIEGLDLFEKLFGYRASYFVPPNGPFNNTLNYTLYQNGIKFRSTSKIQKEPVGDGRWRNRVHWLGQKDNSGIRYITRNCFFEPSQGGHDWIDSCLNDIKISFSFNKPAIISSHRVNYIGALNVKNRDKGLRNLKDLLKSIIKNWPEAEFCTTEELGSILFK